MSDYIHDENDLSVYHTQPSGTSEGGFQGGCVPPEAPRKKKSRRGVKAVALVLACLIVGVGAGAGGAALYGHLSGGTGGTTIYEAQTPCRR